MKALLTLLLLSISTIALSAQNSVFDITKSGGLRFTPGNSFILGSGACSFNWTDITLKGTSQSLFDGAKSYEWDTVQGASSTSSINCTNINTDITGNKITVPLVDPAIFQNRSNAKSIAFSGATIIKISKSQTEPNATYVTTGTFGTTSYFFCELPTYNPSATGKSLELKWLFMTGAEKELANGWILSMTWFGAERKCANMTMSFDPSLLSGSTPPPAPPLQCNPGCVPAQ